MTKIMDYADTTTHHMIDDVEPQDEAMDTFRQHFHLVANCNVVSDGKLMIYTMKGGHAAVWHGSAKNIIASLKLPLIAKVVSDITGTFLHIIYKP